MRKAILISFFVISWCLFANAQWEMMRIGTQNALNGIYFADSKIGYTCGRDGFVFKTIDGGNNWIKQNSGVADDLTAVYFINPKVGFIVGRNGVILKTTDGGNVWEKQNSGTLFELNSVFFINENTGFIACQYGTILKTKDAGTTWNLIKTKTIPFISSVFFLNTDTGYAVNSYGQILKTTDGGINWETKQTQTTRWLHSIHFPTVEIGYAVGSGGIILKTIDGGKSWNFQNSGVHYELYSVYFTSATKGYAVSHFALILQTEDGGETWEVNDTFLTGFLNSKIYQKGDYTSDEYLEASTFSIRNECHGLYSMCFPNAHTGFVCGHYGTILKFETETSALETSKVNVTNSLLSIYPNPAKETVNISTTHLLNESCIMNIYNTMGEIIFHRTLNNAKNNIDVRNFCTGIYLVEIKGDDWVEKEKLVIHR